MKTKINNLLKMMLVVGLTISSLSVKSNNGQEGSAAYETEKAIKESIKLSTSQFKTNQKVEVLFTTNVQGNVNFILVKTDDKALKQEIEKQFSLLHFNKLHSDVVNSVTLIFKTL